MKITNADKVLVISHGFRLASDGPAQDIRDFLKNQVDTLDYIDHPFPHGDYTQTHFFYFKNGALESIKKSFPYMGFQLIRYIQQFIVTFLFLLWNFKQYDICFALDNHSVIAASLFRKLGKIKKLVYYSIDYAPIRFQNHYLNRLYHFADRIACGLSDINWVVAKHMVSARKDNNVDINHMSHFVEVPMGFHKDEVNILPIDQIDPYHLVYMGTILEKQGLQLVIENLPDILKELPKIHLTIIGTGNYENEIKNLISKKKVNKIVDFKGFIDNRNKMYTILSKAGVGLAPYKPTPDSFSYFADPSKIKIYLGCGLPIITTNVTAFSEVIKQQKAGIIIDYSTGSLLTGLKKLLKDKKNYIIYRKAAINLSLRYNTKTILGKAIHNL